MSENGKENKAFDALEQSDDIESTPVNNEEENTEEECDSNDVEASRDSESNAVIQSEDSNVDSTQTGDENENANEEEKEKKANELLSKLETFRSEHFSVCGKKRTCSNIHWFIVLYFIILVSRTCIGSYVHTVAHEIWKRYYISKYEFNFIIGVEKIGFILTLIFTSFYGNKFIKPISILVGAIICGIGAIMCCIPYFMHGHREIDSSQDLPSYIEAGLCLHSTVVKNITYTDQCNQHPAVNYPHENTGAYSLLCSGHFFLGIGTAFLIPAGIVYIDEAEKTDYMALFLGIIVSAYGVGNLLGSLFGYWFVTIPEHLSGPILVSKWHVGAWWIGLVLFGTILILSSIPLIIFPKWIIEPKWLLYRKYRAHLRLERWKKREQEARRRRRKRKREKLRKERERRNIKAKNRTSKGSDDERPSDTDTSTADSSEDTNNKKVDHENKKIEIEDSLSKSETDDTQMDESTSEIKEETGSKESKNDNISNKIEMNKDKTEETDNKNSESNSQKQSIETISKTSNEQPNGTTDSKRRYRRHSPSKVRIDKTPAIEFSENDTDVEASNNKKTAEEKNKQRYRLGRKLEDLPKNLLFLLTRPLFLVTTFAASLSLYLQAGYFLTMSSYFQRQFQYAEKSAGLIPCAVYGIAIVIGCMTSGILIHRFKLSLKSQFKMCMISQAGVIIGLLVLMALGCNLQQSPLNIDSKGVIYTTCASECDCSLSQLHKVCDRNAALSYASPCHAGCKKAAVNPESKIVQYESCNCVPDGELTAEWCETQCTLAVVYVLILLVVVTLQASAYVTVILLMLRSLPEKLRSITLGFSWWIIYLTAFVPGVAIYNSFFDLSCTISSENCKEESECWSYDSPLYRYVTHGATIAFIVIGLVLFVISYIIFIKTKKPGISQTSESSKDKSKQKYVKENGSSNDSSNGVQNKAFSGESNKEVSSI